MRLLNKYAVIEMEKELCRVTVFHPLLFALFDTLAGHLIFQFQSDKLNAIQHQHHVNGVMMLG